LQFDSRNLGLLLGNCMLESDYASREKNNFAGLLPIVINALLLLGSGFAGLELSHTLGSGEHLDSVLEGPPPEELHFYEVQNESVCEGDSQYRNTPWPANLTNTFFFAEETVNGHEHREDLSSNDNSDEEKGGSILPKIARNPGRENDKVRARRYMKIHDRVQLIHANFENVLGHKIVCE